MNMDQINGGVCAPDGYLAAGVAAGIKSSAGLDLALIVSKAPAAAAGIFTVNGAAAAPVLLCKDRIRSGSAQGVVVNSGCANACTGERGMRDAKEMGELAAVSAKIDPALMLVCSTGLIGSFLPMDRIRQGVKAAAVTLTRDDKSAMRAILTTDTRPKRIAFRHADGWSIGGIAKGAGMIAPNMATMLAFITTDAVVDSALLQKALSDAAGATFNAITVDGEASTNDTVLAFANGISGLSPPAEDLFYGVEMVCRALAEMIVADGEGATKVIAVHVTGAADGAQARLAARAVAESVLVKTAVYGQDANWGRIVAALGNSGAAFQVDRVNVSMAGVKLFDKGAGAGPEAVLKARRLMSGAYVDLDIDLGAGEGSDKMLSTDLTPEYVKLNAAYE